MAEEYGFDVWTTANGLPQNTITGVAQTPDGYLWLSTFDGLARFDGVRFTIFDKGNTKGIVNNRFTGIFVDREGTLFAAADNHVITVYRNGTFTSYSHIADTDKTTPYTYLKADAVGNAIIETDKAEYYLQNGQFVETQDQKVKGVKQIFFGKSGAKWVFEPNQISRIKDGQVTNYQINLNQFDVDSSLSLIPFEDKKGALWIVKFLKLELWRLQDGKATVFTKKEIAALSESVPRPRWEDDEGNLWFLFSGNVSPKPVQLVRFKDNVFTANQFDEALMFTSHIIDREGNHWLGTATGLRRLRRKLITTLSVKDGLNSNEVYPLFQTANEDIYIGTNLGVNRYRGGKITDLGVNLRPEFPVVSNGLFEENNKGLWIGYVGGFQQFDKEYFEKKNNAVVQTENPDIAGTGASNFSSDREGNIWVSTSKGLLKYKDGKEIRLYTTDDGLPNINVVLSHTDRQGNLWVGTFDGLAILKNGRFTDFKSDPDSPKGYIRAIFEDANGVLWFGTYADGLYRYKDGKFFNYRIENGLFNNGVFAILEDERGNFWMSSNRGIHRVSKQELSDFADGKIPKLNSLSYNEKDGMLNAECNGGRIPAAIKTKDGKLWFATMGGVAIVDPNAEKVNPLPPNVVIENISIDRKVVEQRDSQIELKPGQSNIAIEYTGLSLIKSEQVKFRYKLEGLEENWVEAGTKRTVDYSYLPAGTYNFRVIAANADGVWNETGSAIKIIVHPYFYKTWWFIGLLALAVALLIWWIYHTRVSRLREIAEAKTLFSRQLIESQEAERKRIASELHDGLGQNLVVIKNRAMLGIKKGDDKQRVAKELNIISESATQALDEVREITNDLRPQLIDRLGLTKAINSMLKKVSGVINLESEIDSIDGIFNETQEISIYRIVQESLNNVIKHSNASDVRILIKRDESKVLITIEDNGKGFDTANIKGGLGLIGLKERAQLLNGEFSIDSKIGEGTNIRVEFSEETRTK